MVWIVVAAFNEGERVGSVVKGLVSCGYRNVVVVDDCSSDSTFAVAAKAGATVLRHAINRGQGASLRTGIEYALEQGADVVVTFDADGQHRVEDLPAILEPVMSGRVDVSLGSRFLADTRMPFLRKVLLKGSVMVIWLFYGMRMSDAHNGFRALSRKAAESIEIRQDRMAHASEIIGEIRRKGLSFEEIPVVIRYSEDTMRKGHGGFAQALKVLWNMIMDKVMR